jgi:tetratricopeptide (TPR) repeat protein
VNLAVGIALVLAVAAAAFQLGGMAPGAGPLLVVVAGVLAAIQGVRGARHPRWEDRSLVLVLALAASPLLVGAAELVPLPRAAIRAVAPRTAELYDRDEAAAEAPPTLRPISVEPGTSRRALARGAALFALFLVGASVARHHTDARAIAIGLVTLAAFVALDGLVEGDGPLEAGSPWRGRARAPFWNPNNFAAFLEIVLPLAVGLALARPVLPARSRQVTGIVTFLGERPDLVVRLGALAAAGLLVAGAAQSQSRAALAAAALGLLATIVLSGTLRRRHLLPLTGLLVALALGAGWANSGAAVARFGSAPDDFRSRRLYWEAGVHSLRGRSLTGGGLGTYDALSFAEITSSVAARAGLIFLPERAHNDYLNLATDLGVPAALLGISGMLAAVAVVAARLRRGRAEKTLTSERRAIAAGAVGGVVAALAHSFLDFGLEIPAVGAAFAVTLGLAWGLSREHGPDGDRRAGSRLARGAGALLAIGLAALGARDFLAERSAATVADLEKRLPSNASPDQIEHVLKGSTAALAWIGDDYKLVSGQAHLLRRAGAFDEAIAPAREAVRLAPARAQTQGTLALALIAASDSSTLGPTPSPERLARARALRAEGERRLLLALELAPCYADLLFSAGMYFLDRAAETNAPATVDRALRLFIDAARYQDPDPTRPEFLGLARQRVEYLSRKRGLLGPFAEQLLHDLTTRPTEPPREGAARRPDSR